MKDEKDIALYGRVSLDDNGSRFQDVDNQIEPLKEYCKRMNWNVKYVFVDKRSGADSNRPEFKRMLAEARQHHFDLLLVWSLDRFSREPLVTQLGYLKQLEKHNIRLRSYTENFDTGEKADTQELLMIISMWLSGYERKKISLRTRAGITRKKAQGTWKGGRPFKNKLEGGKTK